MSLYEEDGRAITTQSMLKTFRRCPKQTEFKYVRGLRPKLVSKPLKRGQWMHRLLESHYRGDDWKKVHARERARFNELFEEEQEQYGDLPTEIERLMTSYLWHYKHEEVEVVDVEYKIETEFPDGTLFRGKVDMLIRDEYGLWLWDHKTHRSLPDLDFRILDVQSALYLWAELREGRKDLQGFIWSYVRTKAPTVPQITQKGELSKRKIETDFPTLARVLKENEIDAVPHREWVDQLRGQQYREGAPQTSSFFRRERLEKSTAMLKRVAQENFHTSKRMHAYFPAPRDAVERTVSNSCRFDCGFVDLCTAELFGGRLDPIIKQRYVQEHDPLSYYEEGRGEADAT